MNQIIYEDLDAFFEQMQTMNKDKLVYMTIVRSRKEQLMAGAVRVMFKDDTGVFHAYNHTEDIPEITLLSAGVFDLIPNEEQSKTAKAEYMAIIDGFEKALKTEFEKMKSVLTKEFGVIKIINAYQG